MTSIPIAQLPAQTFKVTLDGQDCTISLYWRQERLYLDLRAGRTVICQGAVCQNRASLIQSPSRFFSGSLHFYDRQGDKSPLWERLSSRYQLIYVPEGEALPAKFKY